MVDINLPALSSTGNVLTVSNFTIKKLTKII